MNTVTHALLPVIAVEVLMRGRDRFGVRGLLLVGLAGALPDLLNPHLSLEARMQSWSHGLPFLGAFSFCLLVAAFLSRGRLPTVLAVLIALAYLLHLFCDAISGGINWLYPVSDWVWGGYWVHPKYWVPLDIIGLLVCYTLFRLLPLWRKRRSSLEAD